MARGPLDQGVQSIAVSHNVEMAHRLHLTRGKCEQVHGHSWKIDLTVTGEVSKEGVVYEFGRLKRVFRSFLDGNFDHQLLLHEEDPFFQKLRFEIPGARSFPFDPTTENFAYYIWNFFESNPDFSEDLAFGVDVWETDVNYARYP